MLSKEQVKHIAKLARLSLSKREIEKFRRDLSSILGYVEKLNKVDLENVEPTFHALKIENVFREDKEEIENPKTIQKLIACFPKSKEYFLKVRSVFHKKQNS